MSQYSQIKNETIIFSKELYVLNKAKKEKLIEKENIKYKIVFSGYMDCSVCVITLKEIQKYKDENNDYLTHTQILYVANGSRNEYFDYQVKKNNFNFPIYIDEKEKFMIQNPVTDKATQTFLLNNEDKIVLVGSPINSKKIAKLYKSIIKYK